MVGRPSSVLVVSGDVGTDAWAWLGVNAENNARQTSRTTYKYASNVVAEPPLDGEAPLDCLDWSNPYDYDATLGDALLGHDTCTSHGSTYVSETLAIRGAPSTTQDNTWVKTRVVEADNFGRATKVAYDNDVFRTDDDICVETTYAEPIKGSIPVLGAAATRRISASCDKPTPTLHAETYEWDTMPAGQVSNGFLTSKTVEYFTTDTPATSIRKVRVFDGTYDALGNLVHSISVREEDGAYRETTLTYDSFALAVVKSELSGTNVPPQTTVVKYDPYTFDPLIVTDENGTRRALKYDGFQRILRTSVAANATSSFAITSESTYSNFEAGTADRAIAVTTFDSPTNVSAATGHTETTYLDEIGRAYRRERTLGTDYGGAVLVTAFRTYDPFGRVSFDAEPFVGTESADTAFGTSRYFQPDGTPNCFVRARGPHALTATSDPTSDVYAECFYHGYANHLESTGMSDADSNTPSAPQAGVMRMETATAVGRVLSRVMVRSGERLDYATYAQDRFGNPIAETRFLSPNAGFLPVVTRWRYDSAGRVLEEIEREGQRTRNEYDSWGELTSVVSSDPSTTPPVDYRIVSQYDALGRIIHRDERHDGVIDPETVNDYRYDTGYHPSSLVEPAFTLGRMTMATAASGTSYFSYDANGAQNATVWIDQGGHSYIEKVEHAVDGRMLSMDMYLPDLNYAQEHVDFSYDSNRQLSSAHYESPTQSRMLYQVAQRDPYGRVLNATFGASTFTSRFAPTGRRLLESSQIVSASGARRYAFGNYDAIGRELTRSEQTDNDAPMLITRSYDALGRLATSTQSQGAATTASWNFAYDALGNIVGSSEAVSGSATQMSYRSGNRDQLCSIGFPNGGSSSCEVTHDAAGNVTAMPSMRGPRSLEYFLSGQLRSVGNGGEKATFRYDAFGALQQLDVEGQGGTSAAVHPPDARHEEHFGNIEVHRSSAQGNNISFVARTLPGPGVSVTLRGGNTGDWLYAIGDGRGLRTTVEASGKFVQDVSYSPYGAATSTGPEPGSELYTHDQWNGGDALADFGLSHLNARVYDPVIGRFLSRDPVRVLRSAAASNPYAFAANDPINHSDPSGRDWQDGCIGQECQWYNPLGIVGTVGALFGGHGGGGGGGQSAPPPPSMPPVTGMAGSACEFADAAAGCADTMFPTWRNPGFWGRANDAAHAFGRGWVRAGDWIRDTASHAAGYVAAHKKYFVAAAVFVVVATTQPELLVAEIVTGGGVIGSILSEAPAEDAAVAEAEVPAAEEAAAAAYDEAQLIQDGFTRRAPSPGDAHFPTADEALSEALQRHGIDPGSVESTAMYGKNANLVGPQGQPWQTVKGLDANADIIEFEHHANGHVFTDTSTYELPHFHGPSGEHITYPW
jgi:RHS repeat-associated protein